MICLIHNFLRNECDVIINCDSSANKTENKLKKNMDHNSLERYNRYVKYDNYRTLILVFFCFLVIPTRRSCISKKILVRELLKK